MRNAWIREKYKVAFRRNAEDRFILTELVELGLLNKDTNSLEVTFYLQRFQ